MHSSNAIDPGSRWSVIWGDKRRTNWALFMRGDLPCGIDAGPNCLKQKEIRATEENGGLESRTTDQLWIWLGGWKGRNSWCNTRCAFCQTLFEKNVVKAQQWTDFLSLKTNKFQTHFKMWQIDLVSWLFLACSYHPYWFKAWSQYSQSIPVVYHRIQSM